MNNRKRLHRFLSTLLIVIMLIPVNISFGASFIDVNTSHWAYEFIEDMAKLKFINGYPDKTFKPDNSINMLEALQLISKLVDVSENEKATIRNKYATLTTALEIPDWAKDAVGICLDRGIISEAELRTAYTTGMLKWGTNKIPSRLTISIYLAKAMGLEEEAAKKTVVFLPYKDKTSIDQKYHNLLYMLIETEVLNPQGTGNGHFEPTGRIKRDAMAKMMSVAYEYVEDQIQTVDTESLRGKITKLTPFGSNTSYIEVEDRDNRTSTFFVESKTLIRIDDKVADMSKLYVGQDIELSYKKGSTEALTINASSVEEKISGYIKGISTYTNLLTVEYTVGRNTETSEFVIDKDILVYLDGSRANVSSLSKGDKVDIIVKNNTVVEIDAASREDEVEGIITEIYRDSKTSVYYITIEDKHGKVEYEVDKDATVYRDGKRARIEDLRVLDDVHAELEYDIIIDIDAEVVEDEVEGRIISIVNRLNQPTTITINNMETDKEETYVLSKDVKIYVDGKSALSSDLNTGHYVEMVIGSNEILEIDADSKAAEYFVRGKIAYISKKHEELDIEVFGSDIPGVNYGDEIYVRASSSVKVIIGKNTYNDIDDLIKGDEVLAFGQYDGSVFVVSEITVR